jgi:hypothetical protein
MTDIHQDVLKHGTRRTMRRMLMASLLPVLTSLAAALVLAAIFAAYLQPSFMLDLGNRFFMCF